MLYSGIDRQIILLGIAIAPFQGISVEHNDALTRHRQRGSYAVGAVIKAELLGNLGNFVEYEVLVLLREEYLQLLILPGLQSRSPGT